MPDLNGALLGRPSNHQLLDGLGDNPFNRIRYNGYPCDCIRAEVGPMQSVSLLPSGRFSQELGYLEVMVVAFQNTDAFQETIVNYQSVILDMVRYFSD